MCMGFLLRSVLCILTAAVMFDPLIVSISLIESVVILGSRPLKPPAGDLPPCWEKPLSFLP